MNETRSKVVRGESKDGVADDQPKSRVSKTVFAELSAGVLLHIRAKACLNKCLAEGKDLICARWDSSNPSTHTKEAQETIELCDRETLLNDKHACHGCARPVVAGQWLMRMLLDKDDIHGSDDDRKWRDYANTGKAMPISTFKKVLGSAWANNLLSLQQALFLFAESVTHEAEIIAAQKIRKKVRDGKHYQATKELKIPPDELQREQVAQFEELLQQGVKKLKQRQASATPCAFIERGSEFEQWLTGDRRAE